MKKANIIFMGTPEIAVPTLEKLNQKYKISAVVTMPDKPQGRGKKIIPSPVKIKAIELGLNILQPEDLKDNNFIKKIEDLNPDIIVVFAFRYLPKEVYTIAKFTFNIHTSLLPQYRGAAPINWAIINAETLTGMTSFLLNEKIDNGDIILQKRIVIPYNATAGDLTNIMMTEAPDFAIETCEALISNNYELTSQSDVFEFPAPKLFKENLEIRWTEHAISVVSFINGCSPVPCAWTTWDGKTIQILRAKIPTSIEIIECDNDVIKLKNPGDFCIIDKKLFVSCAVGIAEIIEIKLENKKALSIKDFLNGYRGEKCGKFMMK
ncbi:MAG: methionyl-tRNA formyltransferase [Bacteroidetes bacterium]|nr:methionyl-tRNA formyltransferase [Bacteroidota bacterium]